MTNDEIISLASQLVILLEDKKDHRRAFVDRMMELNVEDADLVWAAIHLLKGRSTFIIPGYTRNYDSLDRIEQIAGQLGAEKKLTKERLSSEGMVDVIRFCRPLH